ncbi:MFS transporter [Haloferula sp.]|uniref:MFS transporter n=1 Tax=Haloferula sp. TaxID=2497595 RepID=UPI003C75E7EE
MSKLSALSSLKPHERRNALLIVLGQTSSKLGDVICNAKTVLTWLMGVIGAPPALTALLVPIRESGSMLPQAFVSGFVKRVRRRKWVYAAGAVGQTLCLIGMGLAALFLKGTAAGIAVILALAIYSLARCLCSISSKDVLGKTLPKGTRGRITGSAASISGFLSLGAAVFVLLAMDRSASQETYGWMILGGSALYLVTATALGFVKEEPSEETEKDLLTDFKERARMAVADPVLRKFIVARTLLLGSALASPYLVILSQQQGFELRSLAAFVLAGGLASALSSLLWGKLSDRLSRQAMALGGGIAGIVGLLGVAIGIWMPAIASSVWTWPTLFFLLNLGYAGVRIGRKTYVVDASEGDQRTDYVSTSNTLIAIMILIMGVLGSALQSLDVLAALAGFSLLCLAGSACSLSLRSTHED